MSAWKRLLAADDKPPRRADDPWALAAANTPMTHVAEHDGFDQARRDRGGAAAWMWAKRIAVGMLLVAGFVQLVVKPVAGAIGPKDAPAAPGPVIGLVAAQAVAVGFSLDYLSTGGGASEGARQAALERWLYPDSTSASVAGSWAGSAVLVADSATVQAVTTAGDDAAVVAVQARVRTYIPSDDTPPTAAPPQASAPGTAFTPAIPSGYIAGPAYWLRLVVPLVDTPVGPRVAAPGPVFSTDDIAPVSVSVESDPRSGAELTAPARKIFEAYAAGDLTYVAGDAGLSGFVGEFTVSSVSDVRVSTTTNSDDSRSAAVDVQWALTAADASIEQTYGVTLTDIGTAAPQLQHVSVLQPTIPEDS